MNTWRKNLKFKGVATSKRQAFFPVSRVTFKVAFPNKTSKKGWWMGWVGSCFFQPESWVDFFHTFFLQRCVQCGDASDALWCWYRKSSNLAPLDDVRNIYVKKNPAFFTTCFVYNKWPTWFLDFCSQKVELTALKFNYWLVTSPQKNGCGKRSFQISTVCYFSRNKKHQDFSTPKPRHRPQLPPHLWNLHWSPRWANGGLVPASFGELCWTKGFSF